MVQAERRQSIRRTLDIFVQEEVDGRALLHPGINISTDGIYILAQRDRRVDATEELELEFTLPTGDVIQARGTVIHVDDRGDQLGLGVRFTALSTDAKQAIANFVSAG